MSTKASLPAVVLMLGNNGDRTNRFRELSRARGEQSGWPPLGRLLPLIILAMPGLEELPKAFVPPALPVVTVYVAT